MAERVVEVRLSAQVQEWIKGMEDAADAAEKVAAESKRVADRNKAFKDIGRNAVVIGGAMTALSIAVMKTGIEYNSLQQKSRAALTTMLGSAEKANEQMDRLDEFARTSPFSKAVFITAQQQMLAFGIEAKNVVPYLNAIQDAVAAAGGSNEDIAGLSEIFGKISSTSKITAVDLMQFGRRGIDAAALIGNAMGKTAGEIRSDITAGTLDAGQALDALADGMQTKFAGAAANVKMTFEGATDRVRAAWRDVSADLMKPLVDPNGGGALIDFLNWTADLMRAFQDLPEPIKTTTAAAFGLTGMILLLGGAALLAWPNILALRGSLEKVGVSMGTVGAVGGGVLLALTLLATAVGIAAGAQAAARQKAEEYAEALKQGEGAARDLVTANLGVEHSFLWMSFGSAYDNAEKLGIGLDIITDAANGSADAMAEFEAIMAVATGGGEAKREMADRLGLSYVELSETARHLTNQVNEQAAAVESGKGRLEQMERATEGAAGATGGLARSAEEAEKAIDGATRALADIGREGWNVGAAADNAQGALNKMADAAKKDGVELQGLNDESIKLRDSMRDVEETARLSAEKIILNGQSMAEAEAEYMKGRDTIVALRIAMGDSAEEAAQWADDNFKSAMEVVAGLHVVYDEYQRNLEVKVLPVEAYTTPARNALDSLIRTYNGTTLRLNVATDSFHMPTGARPQATGNVFDAQAFAAGGFTPGIYPYKPGGIHKFAEEYGEAYLSMDPARKQQSRGVWVESGQRLGFLSQPGGGGGSGLRPGDRLVIEVEGTPLTGTVKRVLSDTVPSAGAVTSEFGR